MSICPYCGLAQAESGRCAACGGHFDVLSRQATQNAMGPWFIRDDEQPFRPGCSYETIVRMIQKKKVTADSVVRGPTTHQFWMPAAEVPGLAHHLGRCPACREVVSPADVCCEFCGEQFTALPTDRDQLGLLPKRDLETMTPSAPTDDNQASDVGYDRLQAALAGQGNTPSTTTGNPSDQASSIEALVQEIEAPAAAIRPPRARRNASERIDPEKLAAEEARKRQARLSVVQWTISVLVLLIVALGLGFVLWSVGVFDFLKSQAVTLTDRENGGDPAVTPEPVSNVVPSEETGTIDAEPTDSTSETPVPAPERTTDEWLGEYEQAILRINDPDLDVLLGAKAVFIAVRNHVEADKQPPDLEESLRRIDRNIERIRQREFIEDGG